MTAFRGSLFISDHPDCAETSIYISACQYQMVKLLMERFLFHKIMEPTKKYICLFAVSLHCSFDQTSLSVHSPHYSH